MEDGYYYTNIRKLRSLYSQKLEATVQAFEKYGRDFVEATNTKSGINITLDVRTKKSENLLCQDGKDLGIHIKPTQMKVDKEKRSLSFYFNQIPLDRIDFLIKNLVEMWKK